MLRQLIHDRISEAIARLQARQELPTGLPSNIEIAETRDPAHGDFACNYALTAAKQASLNPRELAEKLKKVLLSEDEESSAGVTSPLEGEVGELANRVRGNPGESKIQNPKSRILEAVDVAGPGFLNFRLTDAAWLEGLDWANQEAEALARPSQSAIRNPQSAMRLNVEFVSVNPNGPITVGSGRGAAFGSTLCNVLEAAGHEVHREYYINDGTSSEQMRLFAESVKALACNKPVPDNGYKGDYVHAVAAGLLRKHGGDRLAAEAESPEGAIWFQKASESEMLAAQRADLEKFVVAYDTWFSEQSLHDSGKVEADVADLVAKGAADDRPIRHVLKLAKGGVIEDVEIVEQPNEEVDEDLHTEGTEDPALSDAANGRLPTPDASETANRQPPTKLCGCEAQSLPTTWTASSAAKMAG